MTTKIHYSIFDRLLSIENDLFGRYVFYTKLLSRVIIWL